MCEMSEFELEDIESHETEDGKKEVAVVKTKIEVNEDLSEEEELRKFDSEVPVTI